MRPTLALAMLCALAAGGCSEPTAESAPAQFAVTENEYDRNFEGPIINDCTGEEGQALVRMHVVSTDTEDAAGGLHVGFHLNATGTVTFDGARYRFHQTVTDQFSGGVGEERTITATFTLIGQGGAPNEVALFELHFTVRPDGTVATDMEHGRLICR